MGTMIGTGKDVVSFLKRQHSQIKDGFAQVIATRGEERSKQFYSLRRLLAVHETAEEEIVHPAARRALPNGEAVVDARLREENAAKTLLAELEKLDVDSANFDARLLELQRDVLAHAQAEETLEFERLADVLDATRLERMGKAAELAEQFAPTRPHAGVESAAANLFVGPFAAMIDRTRDALSGKG
ncbi:MAG: hemerythrin domain-containing protein [Myxococcota bacterium]|nr:hemerythrin domain-containing protein [Myxococcota bacterium]